MISTYKWVAREADFVFAAANPINVSGREMYVPAYAVAIKNVVVGRLASDPLVAAGANQVAITIATQRTDALGFTSYGYIGPLALMTIAQWNLGKTFGSGNLQQTGEDEATLWPNDGVNFGYRGLLAACDAGSATGTIRMRWEERRLVYGP